MHNSRFGVFMSEFFLRPRLVGKRFDKHTVPLDLLKDFSVFEEMLLEVAKRKYLDKHPERKRLPKGFGKNISVSLSSVEEGSVFLSLSIIYAASLVPPVEEVYFKQARDEIVETISLVEQGKKPVIDTVYLRYFDRFGRSLRDDESIEFLHKDNKATLNHETRKKLLEASKVQSWSENLTLKGYVPAVDKSNRSFEMQLINSSKIKINYLEQFQDDILEAFKGYEKKSLLEIKGIAILDRTGSIKNFETLEHVSLLDPLDIEARIEELLLLEDGWLNGKGKALNKAQAQYIGNAFYINYDDELPLPYLYPTAEGGLLAEWQIKDWEVSLEIDIDSLRSEFHAFNLKTNQESDSIFRLNEKDEWTKINKTLKNFNKEQV